jgi:hypothetical protein
MAVAVDAGSGFLTPFGHHRNTLVMGHGGYCFGDYGRLGLPMSVIIVAGRRSSPQSRRLLESSAETVGITADGHC